MTVTHRSSSELPGTLTSRMRHIEQREWWLWFLVVIVTLLLTGGITSLALALLPTESGELYSLHMRLSVRGLLGLVLLFDIYSLYQQFQIYSVRRQLLARDDLFRVITENIADMIAVVDEQGNRIYNSPAYSKVLGYSAEELKKTSALEQVHPDDRARVARAATQARKAGQGELLEYRMQHKDGSWRYLESIASVVPDSSSKSSHLIILNRDITDRKRMQEQLQHNAFHDPLTGLANRALFLDRLGGALNRARRRTDYRFAVLLVDIDDFKKFNDSLGHSAGDRILIEMGRRLAHCLRTGDIVSRQSSQDFNQGFTSDTLARLGGDEFTILLEDIGDAGDAMAAASRIQQMLAATPFSLGEHEVFASASVGIAMLSGSYSNPEELLRDADIAMYRAKASGKGQCEVFDAAMHDAAMKRLDLESALRRAIDNDEFRIVYQPVVRLCDTRIVGFEALVRWDRPNVGLLAPSEFIAVAEESGLIVPLNRHLRIEACAKIREWQRQFPSDPPLALSLNVSARELAYPMLTRDISEALKQTGLAPSCLQLEVLETVAMREGEPKRVLAEAKALGVRLSIDDFGSGYSSLGRLRHLPADTLKIDRAFIARLDTDDGNREIVETIVALAHNFGLQVVAEGTETLQEVNILLAMGCDYAQGYYFSRPVAADIAAALLQAGCLRQHFALT